MAGKAEKNGAAVLFFIRGFLIFVLNLVFYVIVVFGTVELCKAAYSFSHEVFGEVMAEAPPGNDRTFVIQEADSAFTVATNLERQGIVANTYSFFIRLKLTMTGKGILSAGTYTLNTSMTYEEILDQIVKVPADG